MAGNNKNDKGLRARPVPQPVKIAWWQAGKLDLKEYGPAATMLVDYAVENHLTVFSGGCRGVFIEEDEEGQGMEKILMHLTQETGATSHFSDSPIFGRGTNETWLSWDQGYVRVQRGMDNKFDVRLLTLNQTQFIELTKLLGEFLLPEFVRQPIYSLAMGTNGIEIGEVGVAGVPLERGNYPEDAIDAFQYIVDDLQRANPMGRLSIVQGEPGTGKTYFIRGILHEVYDAIFILVPPGMVEDLAGPALIPTLIRARSMVGIDKPIVLLVEDADKALVPRESRDSQGGTNSNLGAISALLNASDGILGTALNLRIICTTNATIDEIDSALLRPGRLSKQIKIGLLDVEKAKDVFNRLSDGEEADFNQEMSLGQVYDFYKFMDIEQDREEEAEGDDEVDDEDEDWDEDDEDEDDD